MYENGLKIGTQLTFILTLTGQQTLSIQLIQGLRLEGGWLLELPPGYS